MLLMLSQHCNKEYILNLTPHEYNISDYRKTCCNSCSAKLSNYKRKINGYSTKNKTKDINCQICGEVFQISIHSNKKLCEKCEKEYKITKDGKIYKINDPAILEKNCCVICNKIFYSKRVRKTCSNECCKELRKINGYKIIKMLKDKGKWKSWQSRNITSYPERFWMEILKNNNINYIREDHSNGKYFLDFLIEKNGYKIDLEIDGKQHKVFERMISDIKRDNYLKNLNYII